MTRRWKRAPKPIRRWAGWIATLAVVVWLAAFAYFLEGQADNGVGGLLLGLAFLFVAGWVTWRYSD